MKAIKLITLTVIVIFLAQTASMAQDVKIEVVDFHSTNRCYTCNVIEAYAKKTVETHFADKKNVSFSVFNVDEPSNKPVLQEFRAFGSSLFLKVTKNGKSQIINISQFAFMNARNEERFVAGLKQEIEKHLGS
jgi:hypothetical protein